MELSDLITRYRKESQLTIDELAEQSGVPKGTLTKIIGRITKAPSLETVKAIAHALGKTLADFDDESVSVDPLQEALLDSFLKLNQEGKERLVETAARGGGIKTIPADAADAVSREMIPTDNDLL